MVSGYYTKKLVLILFSATIYFFCSAALLNSMRRNPYDARYAPAEVPSLDRKLAVRLLKIEPWRTTNYQYNDWTNLICLAQDFQHARPEVIVSALKIFRKLEEDQPVSVEFEPETKAFLLFRIMFDLPEKAPRKSFHSFRGWFNVEDAYHGDFANLAWPVGWNGGQPRLVSGYKGSSGGPYIAEDEYQYMRRRYGLRSLAEVSHISNSAHE